MFIVTKDCQAFVDCEGMIEDRLITSFFKRNPESLGLVSLYIKLKDEIKEIHAIDNYLNDKVEVVNDIAFYKRENDTLAEWNGRILTVYGNAATEIVKGLYSLHSNMFEREFRPLLFPAGFRPTCCDGFFNKYPLILDIQTGDINYDIEKYIEKFCAARGRSNTYLKVIQRYKKRVPKHLEQKVASKAFKLSLDFYWCLN